MNASNCTQDTSRSLAFSGASELLTESEFEDEKIKLLLADLDTHSISLTTSFRDQAYHLSLLEQEQAMSEKLTCEIEQLKKEIENSQQNLRDWPSKFAEMQSDEEKKKREIAIKANETEEEIFRATTIADEMNENYERLQQRRKDTKTLIQTVDDLIKRVGQEHDQIHSRSAGLDIIINSDVAECNKKVSEALIFSDQELKAIQQNTMVIETRFASLSSSAVKIVRRPKEMPEEMLKLKAEIAATEGELARLDAATIPIEDDADDLNMIQESMGQCSRRLKDLVDAVVSRNEQDQNEALAPVSHN